MKKLSHTFAKKIVFVSLFLTALSTQAAQLCQNIFEPSDLARRLIEFPLGDRTILNSAWREVKESEVKSSWSPFRQQYVIDRYNSYWDFYTPTKKSEIESTAEFESLETAPFEMASAKWINAEGEKTDGYYIRLKDTKEVIGVLEHSYGFHVIIRHKYLKSPSEKKSDTAYTLHGAMIGFFKQLGRDSFHNINTFEKLTEPNSLFISDGPIPAIFKKYAIGKISDHSIYGKIKKFLVKSKAYSVAIKFYRTHQSHFQSYQEEYVAHFSYTEGIGLNVESVMRMSRGENASYIELLEALKENPQDIRVRSISYKKYHEDFQMNGSSINSL